MSDIERAIGLLKDELDPDVFQAAVELVNRGEAAWRLDPSVDGVVGLTLTGTMRAVLVVYVDDEDWELDEQLFPS